MIEFISFSKKLLLFSVFVFLILLGWNHAIPLRFTSPHVWYIFGFFIISTGGLQYVFINISQQKATLFIKYYLAIIAVKMFVYLLFIIVYALFNRDGATGFILSFLILYLLYTVFEVTSLLKLFRRTSS